MRFSKATWGIEMSQGKIGSVRRRSLTALRGVGVALVLMCAANPSFAVIGPNGEVAKPFVIKGEVVIQLTPDVRVGGAQRSFGRVSSGVAALDAVFTRHHVSEMRAVFPWRSEDSPHQADRDLSRFQILTAPEDADLDLLIEELLQTGKALTAEKNWAMPLLETAAVPNDPDWGDQYSPTLIGATSVWDVEPGSDTAKIAMIDSGVNYKHADLKPMIWVNPGEDLDGDGEVYDTDDLNGVDDDGNGVIDDLIGYDFFTGLGIGVLPGEDGGGPDTDPNDFDGHGTH
ncbi:MAG TPA: hypothetical protein VLB27_00085, partial [candidate division Zixibacteria bacterium]|nr:hypothetical protein [candidate division Zixibacteria bacterium]